jgi:hypothetical protein
MERLRLSREIMWLHFQFNKEIMNSTYAIPNDLVNVISS